MAAKSKISKASKRHMCEIAGLMYSLGATWETIITELYRFTLSPNFDKWSKEDIPTRKTLHQWILKEANCDASQLKENKLNGVRTRLQTKAVQMALKGHPAMLIFCLKNLCNWRDKTDITADGEFDVTPFSKIQAGVDE